MIGFRLRDIMIRNGLSEPIVSWEGGKDKQDRHIRLNTDH